MAGKTVRSLVMKNHILLFFCLLCLFSSCKSQQKEYISFISALEEDTGTGIYDASIKLNDYIASQLKRPLGQNLRFLKMLCGRANSGEAGKKEKFAIMYTLYDVFLVNGKGDGDGNDPFYRMNDLDADKYELIGKTLGNFLVKADIDNDDFWLWVKSVEPVYKYDIFTCLLLSAFKYYSKDDIVVLLDKTKAALGNSALETEWKDGEARPGRLWLYGLNADNLGYVMNHVIDRSSFLELFPSFVGSELFNIQFETQYILDASVRNAQGLDDQLSKIAEITQKLNIEELKSYRRHFRLPEAPVDTQARHYLYNVKINEHEDIKSLLSAASQSAGKESAKPRYLIALVQAPRKDNDKPILQIPAAFMLALGADQIPSSVSEVDRIIVFETSYSPAFTYSNGVQGYRCTIAASIVDAKTGKKLKDLGRWSNDPPEWIRRNQNDKSGEFAVMDSGFIFKTIAEML
jgi:hypothetical protein